MSYQAVFKRYELKYLLTPRQKEAILQAMAPQMALDAYGRTTIRNLYFDTDTYRLARHSIEKPVYKEKLRVRSYGPAGPNDSVFVELKKKYDAVVYKRRLVMPNAQALAWLCRGDSMPDDGQIAREIEYFRRFYQTLRPVVFLSYEREAFYAKDGGDFRITLDENILSRQDALALDAPLGGQSLLAPGMTLMELKTSGGLPLWMTRALTGQRLFKTSFSKYGAAYQTQIFRNQEGSLLYA